MNKTTTVLIIAAGLLLSSCLKELPLEVSRSESQLVVEGYISDKVEVYRVKLSSITNFDGTSTSTSFVRGATVEIIADGIAYPLTERENGLYETNLDVFGEVGRSYQLTVELTNGERYQSSFETIPNSVDIISGSATYEELEATTESGSPSIIRQHRLDLQIDNTSGDHFYIFENRGWAEVEMSYGDCGFGNAPPAAGPTICWAFREIIERSTVNINNNLNLSADNYQVYAGAVPLDFRREYIATIRLNAMSPRSFELWNAVNDQLNRPGGIFDRPFAPIIGNIVNTNGDKIALGYFHAYATSELDICIDRSGIIASISIPGPFPCPVLCTEVFSPATFTDVSQFFCD